MNGTTIAAAFSLLVYRLIVVGKVGGEKVGHEAFHLVGGVVLQVRYYVRVGVICNLETAMPQKLLKHLQVDVASEQDGSGGMAQGVEVDLADSGLLQVGMEH